VIHLLSSDYDTLRFDKARGYMLAVASSDRPSIQHAFALHSSTTTAHASLTRKVVASTVTL
jgi:hypothetical protein